MLTSNITLGQSGAGTNSNEWVPQFSELKNWNQTTICSFSVIPRIPFIFGGGSYSSTDKTFSISKHCWQGRILHKIFFSLISE